MADQEPTGPEIAARIARDDVEAVVRWLDGGLDPRAWLDLDDETSLLGLAVAAGSVGVAAALLARGGDWSLEAAYDGDLEAPFSQALRRGSVEMVDLFLRHGAVEAYAGGWLADAVDAALGRGGDEACRSFLVRLAERLEGDSALLDAAAVGRVAGFVKKSAGSEGESGRWAPLAARWRALGRADEARLAAIVTAARRGLWDRALRQVEALPERLRSRSAGELLIVAAFDSKWEEAEALLALGAEANLASADGQTALMGASWNGHLGLVRRLLAAGADPTRRDRMPQRYSAIDYARVTGKRAIAAYLEKRTGAPGGA